MTCPIDITALEALLDEEILSAEGDFIYSPVDALKSGELYILGTNPGQVCIPTMYPTIREQMRHLPEKRFNHYYEAGWALEGACRAEKVRISPVTRKLEKVIAGLERGYALKDLCASNLIFVRSKDLDAMTFGEFQSYARRCWPAHRIIMDIVQPKALLVFGNGPGKSAYAFLKEEFPCMDEGSFPAGHGRVMVRWLKTPVDGRETLIVGLPHMSRFSLKAEATSQIKALLAEQASFQPMVAGP